MNPREQTYYRWRREYGDMKMDQARRLKEIELENTKPKRLVSELSLKESRASHRETSTLIAYRINVVGLYSLRDDGRLPK